MSSGSMGNRWFFMYSRDTHHIHPQNSLPHLIFKSRELGSLTRGVYVLPGDWLISILCGNKHIQGSPFNVSVYDASMVKVYGLEGGAVGNNFSFTGQFSSSQRSSTSIND